MNRKAILAHRGWWTSPSEKNSAVSIERALVAGFGVETDFRDLNGKLVISHDPPTGTPLNADWFFRLYVKLAATGRIALNIKSDGLQDLILEALKSANVPLSQIFVFDMAIPDALRYMSALPSYARVSEYENPPALESQAEGIWVDNITGGFHQVECCINYLNKGLRVAMVSPELHQRDPKPMWDKIIQAGLHRHPCFELCTDYPDEAHTIFGCS